MNTLDSTANTDDVNHQRAGVYTADAVMPTANKSQRETLLQRLAQVQK
ncbi:MAG: hypothetical protein ACLRPQ_06970 [Streptococcus sp.]